MFNKNSIGFKNIIEIIVPIQNEVQNLQSKGLTTECKSNLRNFFKYIP